MAKVRGEHATLAMGEEEHVEHLSTRYHPEGKEDQRLPAEFIQVSNELTKGINLALLTPSFHQTVSSWIKMQALLQH